MMKTAQVGVGGWGKNHVRVLHEMGALAAVCDTDATRARPLAEKYGVPYHADLASLLGSRGFEAAVVATPTTTHYEVARELIRAGKHTLVEKPLTYDPREGRSLLDTAARAGVALSCGYIERFNPVVQAVRGMVERQTYGRPVLLEFHRENRIPLHIKDVGIIYDTAVHDIDTANWLFGQMPHIVFARCGRVSHAHEDFATIMLGYDDDHTAVISCNWLSPRRVRMLRAAFSEAVVTGDFLTQNVDVDDELLPGARTEPLRAELESFLEAAGAGRDPVVRPIQAVRVSEIARAALLSSQRNAPIHLDLR